MTLSKTIWANAVISLMSTAALAQQATGTVTKVDEQKGTISIELAQGGTIGATGSVQDFKAQDRLLFNELRPGDKVLFRVFEADGAKTITRLDKENVSTTPTAQNSGAGITQPAGQEGSGMMGRGMMAGGMMDHCMMGRGSPVMLRMMFALIDTDGDGTISLQEFQAAHERIFKAMDTNKDGKLTLEEMQAFMHGTR
jgi:Cu/Ag efflux protein CusF